jgi:hypothetical protein
MALTGSCLCGAVRYNVTGEPRRALNCCCIDCRKAGGSLFHYGVVVGREEFKIVSGRPSVYETAADSGRKIKRHFCPTCGSGIYNEPEALPDDVVLRGGSIDSGELLPPTLELFAESRPGWVEITSIERSFRRSR